MPRDQIAGKLKEIEETRGVKILLAVEAGSRVWGFSSVNSDFDVRFIYVRHPSKYLSVQNHRDVIELPVEGDLDISGWDLVKALGLMGKSNPPLLEWLMSREIYLEVPDFMYFRMCKSHYYSDRSCWFHYHHMAAGNLRKYLSQPKVLLKKYLYVIRPLLCCRWIRTHTVPPPLHFDHLVSGAELDSGTVKAMIGLAEFKRQGFELGLGDRNPVLDAFIENEMLIRPFTGDRERHFGPEMLDWAFHVILSNLYPDVIRLKGK